MPSKHYDVVVLGRSIGALTAAALLARRDFTVLVLGQGERPAGYHLEGRELRRRAFTLLSGQSPAWRRVLAELAQSQTWARRVVPASPMFQVLAPGLRLDVPPDMALLLREVEREFSELRRVVDDLYADLARVNAAADEAFERDAVWPPGTFWERRETNRYAAMLPFVRAEPDADLLVEFPRLHPFRDIVGASVSFATDLAAMPPPFAVARLHGAWTRGLMTLPRGEDELTEFLVERIENHGGRCALGERAAALHLRGNVCAGVLIDGETEPTGAEFVITDVDGEQLAALAHGQGIHKRAQREWPRIDGAVARFVTSIIVRREGIPDVLGPEAFVLPGQRPGGDRSRPLVHLQASPRPDGEVLLVAETLVAARPTLAIAELRQAILGALAAELPYFERHLLVADSVHDGLPVWVYDAGRRSLAERTVLRGATTMAEPMPKKLHVDPPGYLGLGGEPIRGPIERTLLVGRSVLPALGQEGQLLAAWGAVRVVTRSDKKRQRMRRDMWSKVEIG